MSSGVIFCVSVGTIAVWVAAMVALIFAFLPYLSDCLRDGSIKPIYIYSKYLPFKGYSTMTILCFVIVRKEYAPLRVTTERHETWHVWQQLCLFSVGAVTAGILHLCLWFADVPWAWLVWSLTILLPLGLYVLCWLVEIVLPPYNRAYKDICFESEAQFHEFDDDPTYIPFSFLLFIPNKLNPTYWGIGDSWFRHHNNLSLLCTLYNRHKFLRILYPGSTFTQLKEI